MKSRKEEILANRKDRWELLQLAKERPDGQLHYDLMHDRDNPALGYINGPGYVTEGDEKIQDRLVIDMAEYQLLCEMADEGLLEPIRMTDLLPSKSSRQQILHSGFRVTSKGLYRLSWKYRRDRIADFVWKWVLVGSGAFVFLCKQMWGWAVWLQLI